MASLNKFIEHISYIFSPPRCYGCYCSLPERFFFCADCFKKIPPIAAYDLAVTKTKSVTVYALSSYNPLLRPLILQKRRKIITGSYVLAELIWRKTIYKNILSDFLVPIPLHWTRKMMRGFNQSHEMAKILAQKRDVEVKSLLKRIKRTQYQANLPIEQRKQNVLDAFILNVKLDQYDKYRDKHLVLIDDLMTTGNTIKYAARELFKLKPASVSAIVACRAI